MSRAWRVVVVTVVALVLAGAAAWFLLLRDDPEPVSVGDALTSFREDSEERPSARSPIPEGVYVYATSGYERIDVVTGATHRYPSRSTITVTAAPCGVRLLWRVFVGRSTEWTYCVTPRGLALATEDERHTFYGRTEATTYRCNHAEVAIDAVSVVTSCSTGSVHERGRLMYIGRERVRIDGRLVAAKHVRRVSRITGEARGRSTDDIWFAVKSGLPVKMSMSSVTTNDSPIGDVRYEEEAHLVLTSLTPNR